MPLLLFMVLACADAPPGAIAGPDTGAPAGDSAGSGGDSAGADDTGAPGPWLPLDPEHAWISTDRGNGTGGALADLDGDGLAELIVAYGNDITPGPVAVYANTGGVLATQATWTSAHDRYYGHLSTGDVDGDGWTDVVVSRFLGDDGFSEPGGVEVFLNTGGGAAPLSSTPDWQAEGFFTFANALGDVDLDGDLDLAVAVGESYYNDPDRSLVFVNDGAGDFGTLAAWATEQDRHSFDVAWADFDGDGWLDLAFANQLTGHTLYLGDGTGGLDAAPTWTAADGGFEGNTLDWGDVDGDGSLDLVVSDNNQQGGAGVVRLWCGPALDLCWTSQDGEAYQSAVSLVDVDDDGDLDLAAGAWWGAVRLYRNRGGVLDTTPSWATDVDDIVVEALAWADLDGSGHTTTDVSGTGLVAIPGRGTALSVTGGVAGDGYISGPGAVSATVLLPVERDLVVTDWTASVGNRAYMHE